VKRKIVNLASALGFGLLVSVLALPAKADVGIAFGIKGNSSTFDTTGHEEEGYGAPTSGIEITSATSSSDVDYGSIFLEVVARDAWAGYSVGVEFIPGEASLGSSTRTDTASDSNESSDDSGVYTGKAQVEDAFTIYFEPTVYVNENVGLYAKAGASHVTVNSLESISKGESSSVYGNKAVWGALFGAGVRYNHDSGFLIKLEYAQTEYETVAFTSTTGNKNRITADPEQEAVSLAVGFQF
jgi:opacity protein-like surface antigen